jgi:hypothetical protein
MIFIIAFLAGDVLELKSYHTDINPQYVESLDLELFTIHLLFEETYSEDGKPLIIVDPSKKLTLDIFKPLGLSSFQGGLNELSKIHSIISNESSVSLIVPENRANRKDNIYYNYQKLALQLCNNDIKAAIRMMDLIMNRYRLLDDIAQGFTPTTNTVAAVTSGSSNSSSGSSSTHSYSDGSYDNDQRRKSIEEFNFKQIMKSFNKTKDNKNNKGKTVEKKEDHSWEIVELPSSSSDMSFFCHKCKTDNKDLIDQMICCSNAPTCKLKFHTICIGEKRIPFSSSRYQMMNHDSDDNNDESSDNSDGGSSSNSDTKVADGNSSSGSSTNDILREKYVKKYFGQWKCEECMLKQNKGGGESVVISFLLSVCIFIHRCVCFVCVYIIFFNTIVEYRI